MHLALPMVPMLRSDRAILRNLLIAMVAGSGAAMLLGMSCLNRVGDVGASASVRTSAGGVAPNATGITSVTSFDMPPPGQLGPPMNRATSPRPEPPPPDARDANGRTPNGAPPALSARPDASASAPPNAPPGMRLPPTNGMTPYMQGGAPAPNSAPPPYGTPPGAMPPNAMPTNAMPPGAMPPGAMPPGAMPPGTIPPGAMPPNAMPPGAVPTNAPAPSMDGGPTTQRGAPEPPPPRFATEAPPWAASNYQSNPEAGAGQFVTDTPQR